MFDRWQVRATFLSSNTQDFIEVTNPPRPAWMATAIPEL